MVYLCAEFWFALERRTRAKSERLNTLEPPPPTVPGRVPLISLVACLEVDSLRPGWLTGRTESVPAAVPGPEAD